jgi:hypothetical protein
MDVTFWFFLLEFYGVDVDVDVDVDGVDVIYSEFLSLSMKNDS